MVTNKLFKLFIILIFSACSLVERNEGRSLSSIEESNLVYEDSDHYVFRTKDFDVYKRYTVPLINLSSLSYNSLPYYIFIESENAECQSSQNIEYKVEESRYLVKDLHPRDFLECRAKSGNLFNLTISYIVPKLKKFKAVEAHWKIQKVKSLFSSDEIQLSKIVEKLDEKKELLFFEQEYLMKKYSRVQMKYFKASIKAEQLELNLQKGDFISISDFSGSSYHSEYGEIDYLGKGFSEKGFSTIHALKYAFYCKLNKEVLLPSYGVLFVNRPGRLRCYINSKNKGLFSKKKISGGISFKLSSLSHLTKMNILEKHRAEIAEKIDYIVHSENLNNKKSVENLIKKNKKEQLDLFFVERFKDMKMRFYVAHMYSLAVFKPVEYEKNGKAFVKFYIYYKKSFKSLITGVSTFDSSKYIGEVEMNIPFSKKISKKIYTLRNDDKENLFFKLLAPYLDTGVKASTELISSLNEEFRFRKGKSRTAVFQAYEYVPVLHSQCVTQGGKVETVFYLDIPNSANLYNDYNEEELLKARWVHGKDRMKELTVDDISSLKCSTLYPL